MNILFASILLICSIPFDDCKTSFVITDCFDEPVPGATIFIETCEGEKIGQSTDFDGLATFMVCSDDICEVRVLLMGYAEYNSNNISDECTNDEEGNAKCALKICD